jgi:hypothetical protein
MSASSLTPQGISMEFEESLGNSHLREDRLRGRKRWRDDVAHPLIICRRRQQVGAGRRDGWSVSLAPRI